MSREMTEDEQKEARRRAFGPNDAETSARFAVEEKALDKYNEGDAQYARRSQEEHDKLMVGVSEDKVREIPDRVCIFDTSPYFFPEYYKLGVTLDGVEVNNVAEFCQSEGWARTLIKDGRGRWRMERGKPLTIKRSCMIVVYWRKASPKQHYVD